ncbi:MAG: c-type cytochrome [Candidatus Methylumidiphilus sp.]
MKKFSMISAIVAGALLGGTAQLAFADEAAIAAGQKIYQREGCQTCHGPTAEGFAAFPSLVASAKLANKEEFTKIVLEGKGTMPAHKDKPKVVENIDNLFAFLNDLAAKKKK